MSKSELIAGDEQLIIHPWLERFAFFIEYPILNTKSIKIEALDEDISVLFYDSEEVHLWL